MVKYFLIMVLAVGVLVGCGPSNESDPAVNVPRPAGAEKPAGPGAGGAAAGGQAIND